MIEKRPDEGAIEKVKRAAKRAREEKRSPRLLFVCLGNICRSPAAQGIMEKMAREREIDVTLDSAGFYGGHAGDLPDRRMREAAWQRGYRLDHRSRKIRSYDLDDFDIVFAMDDSNYADLMQLADTEQQESRIVRMIDYAPAFPDQHSVPDPYYEGHAGFVLVMDLLEDACATILRLLKE